MVAKMLQGKVALITGGASGIGQAAAVVFAQHGALIVVADIDSVGGKATVEKVHNLGGQALFVEADIAEPADVQRMTTTVVSHFGRLDCAFNNAGLMGPICPVADIAEKDWDRLMRVSLRGTLLCMQAEIRLMLKQGGGCIVNNASIAGLVASPANGTYTAAKHGLIGLTRAAALENARQGVRINVVCPGGVDTPMMAQMAEIIPGLRAIAEQMTPIGRIAKPAEVAEAAAWLCSDYSSFVVGHALTVDGGYTAQ